MDGERRRTKIVATIGPATSSHASVLALAEAGMDAVRLNFSHGSQDDHVKSAGLVRAVQAELGRPLALITDLQGPKLRIGDLAEPRTIQTGEQIVIAGEDCARPDDLVVAPSVIGEVLSPGNDVLIDDGLVRLVVESVEKGRAVCRVIVGGEIKSHKGVNLPGVPIPIPSLTEKDLGDLECALSFGVDYVALSFVREAKDIVELREIIDRSKSHARVIAKIEKSEAVDVLDDVLEVTDAVMVARGDLGVEMGAATVPLLQKRIILSSLEAGKPVITATQMLESMIEHAEPTRAEASDVANAILDGTAAVMLSGETAVGAYPIEAVRTMDQIARAVEPSMTYRHQSLSLMGGQRAIGQAMSSAACDVADALGAKAIVVPTFSGRTASTVARQRPRLPIIGLSHNNTAVQQMALEWGVVPLPFPEAKDVEDLFDRAVEVARREGLVEPGDLVVLTAGTAVNMPGSTNVIKVEIA
ncbi:MAG TPA: pyruvate kinase [Gaiellaceae bacterium]|jgi:pyruvate kinase